VRELVDVLNMNAGLLNLIFSFLVALATVAYAVLTVILVRETRRLREAQTEPLLSISVEPMEGSNLMFLAVENVGAAAALDVTLATDPDIEVDRGQRLSDYGLFKHGMRVLAPRQRLSLYIANIAGKIEDVEKRDGRFHFTVMATYRNAAHREYRQSFELDLRHLVGMWNRTPTLQTLANAVEALQKDLHHVSTGFHRLQVVTRTWKDVQRQDREAVRAFRRKQRAIETEQAKKADAPTKSST